jgi:hypothetical protein
MASEVQSKPPTSRLLKTKMLVREQGQNPSQAMTLGEYLEANPGTRSITIGGETFPNLENQK